MFLALPEDSLESEGSAQIDSPKLLLPKCVNSPVVSILKPKEKYLNPCFAGCCTHYFIKNIPFVFNCKMHIIFIGFNTDTCYLLCC